MDDVDVLIWGSAIASSTLARQLAEAGRRVVVIPRGPASYPATPGFSVDGDRLLRRADHEAQILDAASQAGAEVLDGRHVDTITPYGRREVVEVGRSTFHARCVIFGDGADPRIGRQRGLLPDWEPWQLVHFAYEDATGSPGQSIVAGVRRGMAWRGYVVPIDLTAMVGVGWSLQHEMDSGIHVTELLTDVSRETGVQLAGPYSRRVEVVPWEPRRIVSALVTGNLLAVGDLVGVINPFSLRRTELSVKMATDVAAYLIAWLKEDRRLDREAVHGIYQPLLRAAEDGGPAFPAIPRHESRGQSVRMRIGSMLDRRQIGRNRR
jgi:flavin-dependent dehydrogenase